MCTVCTIVYLRIMKQLLYRMYISCVQGYRSVTDYKNDFMRLVEQNHPTEKENQKVAMYVNGLQPSIQEKIGLQNLWSFQEAINMALKVEMMEKERQQTSFRKNMAEHSKILVVSTADKAKFVPKSLERSKHSNFTFWASKEMSNSTFNKRQNRN